MFVKDRETQTLWHCGCSISQCHQTLCYVSATPSNPSQYSGKVILGVWVYGQIVIEKKNLVDKSEWI